MTPTPFPLAEWLRCVDQLEAAAQDLAFRLSSVQNDADRVYREAQNLRGRIRAENDARKESQK